MGNNSLKTPFIITVSGDPVAGKSSAIQALMAKYSAEGFYCTSDINDTFSEHKKVVIKIAAGELFRKLANYAGRSLDELRALAKGRYTIRGLVATATNKAFFNNLQEEDLDKTIDAFIDSFMITTIKQMTSKCVDCDEIIIIADSRIAGILMTLDNHPCMKIKLAIQPEIAAERLIKDASNRPGEIVVPQRDKAAALKSAQESLEKRSAEDRARFIMTYSKDITDQSENSKVDLQNPNNYDLIINTSGTTIENEISVLYSCIELARNQMPYHRLWRSTKYIYPGCVTYEIIPPGTEPLIRAIKIKNQYYALDGQEFVGIGNHRGYKVERESGNDSGYPLLPVQLIGEGEQIVFVKGSKPEEFRGEVVQKYIQRNITADLVRNFERKYNFKYPEHGVEPLKSGQTLENEGMIK